MTEQLTPEQRTAKIAEACVRMRKAETRHQQEQILEELAQLIRTPTSTFFVEGL